MAKLGPTGDGSNSYYTFWLSSSIYFTFGYNKNDRQGSHTSSYTQTRNEQKSKG